MAGRSEDATYVIGHRNPAGGGVLGWPWTGAPVAPRIVERGAPWPLISKKSRGDPALRPDPRELLFTSGWPLSCSHLSRIRHDWMPGVSGVLPRGLEPPARQLIDHGTRLPGREQRLVGQAEPLVKQ